MATINISLEKQLLTIQNREIISSGDSNYDVCSFTFDEEWEGFIKTAVFYQDRQKIYYAVLDDKNKCTIPAPAIVYAKPLYIGVFGVYEDKIITSTLDTIALVEGAITGQEINIEPSESVFASIVAGYQAILNKITEQNRKLEVANGILQEQTELLKKVNAFEIEPLEHRMSAMEIILSGYSDIINESYQKTETVLQEIKDSAFLIKNIEVAFDENNEYILEDERINEECIVNAYFDVISVEATLNNAIFAESFNGFIKFSTTTKFTETLSCTVEVRRH